MRQSSKVEGTKIAQAAKDLNVTSVTIRRYIAEFNIETTADENGIKVLPDQAMEELQEIRRLKEEGLTNPKVLEFLEDFRTKKPAGKPEPKSKAKKKAEPAAAKVREVEPVEEEVEEEAPKPKKTARRITAKPEVQAEPVETVVEAPQMDSEQPEDQEDGEGEGEGDAGDGKSKHSLTCQTCSKVFEHMNPRLRDCLECYRAKRKERRRGGSGERHKNVIQHPLAQQAASKAANQTDRDSISARAPERDRPEREPRVERERAPERERGFERERAPERDRGDRGDRGGDRGSDRFAAAAAAAPVAAPMQSFINVAPPKVGVRNYRKAIEETRQITGSLKRRLERPDLPEGERRWLEQIYAYQLILHQGWRHLAEYRAATPSQGGSKPAHQSAGEE